MTHSEHHRPDGTDDATVAAVGKLTEALETVERARGHLYSFHQLTGSADFDLGDAAELLEKAGHHRAADRVRAELVGRNVLEGRWTFQVVEEYDDGYYGVVKAAERDIRNELVAGRRHVYEAELKEARRTHGRPGHEATPHQAVSNEATPRE
ncbi:hypothetical protein V5P93_002847 [Actinokineospora auranticolor]|uniref:Uncharacterized protein n=1 Tax=Actinokineospora auranticolor TaxID=155976 RepID=A0A2S6H0K1_9PSEU|nr:hypothetical protein [Actinokineospora auranticolor]PPK70988.1 hypothetical protein CLV40_101174 [Actinokineospora auranticolor]